MAGDQEEDKLEFTPDAEVPGYISLAQARVLAMTTARETPGGYSRRYRNVPMAFGTVDASEDEDFYNITLSFRPQGEFSGTSGQEQFFIEKEGRVAHRQVTSLPRQARRSQALPISIGLVIVGVIVAVIAAITIGGTGDGGLAGKAAPPKEPTTSTTAPADTPIPDTGAERVTSSNSIAGAVNNAPMAVDDADDADNGGTVEIDVTSNDMDVDGDTLTIVSVTDNTRAYTYYNNGMNHYDDKNYEQAIREFTNAIQLNPDHQESFSRRSSSYLESGQLQEALQDANEAVRLDPGFAKAFEMRCQTYRALGEPQKALDDCNKAIQLEPGECCTHYIRAHIYGNQGEHQKAIEDFAEAIRIDPLYAAAYDGRRSAYRILNQYQEADADQTKACSLDAYFCTAPTPTPTDNPIPVAAPTANASSYFKKGEGFIEDGKYRLAVDEFTTAIRLNPGYTSAYWTRGWAYDDLGQYQQAIQDFDKAIQLDPYDSLLLAMAYDGRGLAYRMLGRNAEADADEAKACSVDSQYC